MSTTWDMGHNTLIWAAILNSNMAGYQNYPQFTGCFRMHDIMYILYTPSIAYITKYGHFLHSKWPLKTGLKEWYKYLGIQRRSINKASPQNRIWLENNTIWPKRHFAMAAILKFKMAAYDVDQRNGNKVFWIQHAKINTDGPRKLISGQNHWEMVKKAFCFGGHFEIQNGRLRSGWKKWYQSFLDSAPQNWQN